MFKNEFQVFKKKFNGFYLDRITPHSTTVPSPAELLMSQRHCTHLDLHHPDVSRKVFEKQD